MIELKLVRWDKTLVLQILSSETEDWIRINDIVTSPYVAGNGISINIGTPLNISTINSDEITFGDDDTVVTVELADDDTRDAKQQLIINALHEMALYIRNDGSLTQKCDDCNNYLNYVTTDLFRIGFHFCKWIGSVNRDWDSGVDYCSKYNQLPENDVFVQRHILKLRNP